MRALAGARRKMGNVTLGAGALVALPSRSSLLIVLFVIGWQAALPFIPVIAQDLGMDEATIGLLIGIQGVAGLLAIFPTGAWLPRFGAHRFAQGAAAGGFAAWLALWLWPSIPVFFVALPLLGACQMMIFMASQMHVVTSSSEATRDHSVGMFLFYTSVGVTLGPLFGSLGVRTTGDLHTALLVALVAGGLALVSVFGLPPAPRTAPLPAQKLLGWITPWTHNIRVSLVTTGIGDFLYVSWSILFPLALTTAGHAPALIGTAFAVRGVTTMLVRPILGALVGRFSRDGLMAVSLFALGGGFWISMALAASRSLSLAGSALFGLGTGLAFPLSLLLLTADVSDERIAGLLGLRQFVGKLGQIAGPVATGVLVAASQGVTIAVVAVVGAGTGLWVILSAPRGPALRRTRAEGRPPP